MNVILWLFGRFSNRGKALSSYRQGLAKARNRDHQGAIDSYTTTIGMVGTPADVKAMALYNRALVYVAAGDDGKGADDLDAVLAMGAALVNVNIKTMARQKLARMETRSRTSPA